MKPVVVIPVFNHEHAIGAVVDQVQKHQLPVLLVDDGSKPECGAVLKDLAKREGVTLVTREQNGGKGAAVMSGLPEAVKLGYTQRGQIYANGQTALGHPPQFPNGQLTQRGPRPPAHRPAAPQVGGTRRAHHPAGGRTEAQPGGRQVGPLASGTPVQHRP